jgi:hypothetical protein
MADDQDYGTLLKNIVSPAEAQSLVMPPPTHAPASGPGESTPLSGSLMTAPSQAAPSRGGLAGYFAGREAEGRDRSGDPQYVKISSQGQIGYLPKVNLPAARQIDSDLKVLDK